MSIASYCRDALLEHGPMTLGDLTDLVVGAGLTQSKTPLTTVQSSLSNREVRLADGRYASPLWLLQGRWLTTRPFRRDDVWGADHPGDVSDEANPTADLAPLLYLLRGGPLFVPGGQVKKSSYYGLWKAPKQWPDLAPRADQLLAYRVVDRALEVAVIEETAEMRMRGVALSSAIGDVADSEPWSRHAPPDVTTKLWPLLVEDSDLLRSPVPPFSSCIAALAESIREQRRRRHEAERFWQPRLVLPGSLQAKAVGAAHAAGIPLDDWLTAFVTEAFIGLPEADGWGDVSYFDQRGGW